MSQHFNLRDYDQPVRVLARINFLSAEEGGRSAPLPADYNPSHNFEVPKYHFFYIGRVEVPDGATIKPGETHDLTVSFIGGPGLLESLSVGRRWLIQEGAQLVARAEVLTILSEA